MSVHDVGLCDDGVNVSDLVLVYGDSAALDHLAGFALRGEDGGLHGKEIQQGAGKFGCWKPEGGDSVEHGEESLLVQGPQGLGGGISEQHPGGFQGLFVFGLPVAHDGHFAGEDLLEPALSGILPVTADEGFNSLPVQHREYLYVALGVVVGDIEPELVELVGGGAGGVQPDVALFGLSELRAVGLPDEGAGEGESLSAVHPADEFRAGGDVAPLVAAAEL